MTMENEADMSPRAKAEFESAVQIHYALKDENDKLKAGLSIANEEIKKLQLALNHKEIEIHDIRRRHDSELATARIDTERAMSGEKEALAQRIAFETLFRNIMAQLKDYVPPAEPVHVPPPKTTSDLGFESISRELGRLAGSKRQQ